MSMGKENLFFNGKNINPLMLGSILEKSSNNKILNIQCKHVMKTWKMKIIR